MGTSFVLDPRAWISPPYQSCPFCGERESYGVLMINGRGYVRRCRSCMKDKRFSLPSTPKKLLYLDQFVISKLMFVLHPDHRERLRKQGDEEAAFWLALFERLDRLLKLQLLACPDSTAHWEESLPSPFNTDLRRMYEHLSADVSYEHPATIKRFQLHAAFLRWLDGTEKVVTVEDIASGAINHWTDRIQVTTRIEPTDEELSELREVRERTHAGLAAEVERWRREPRRRFSEYFEGQLLAAGPHDMRVYTKWTETVVRMTTGVVQLDPEQMLPPNPARTVTILKRTLGERGVPVDQQLSKIAEFFTSEDARQVPWLQIACGMLAALAVKASLQQAPSPDAGMLTDLNTVATLLPYCDAIFIDNRCADLLREATERVPLDYEASVFSTGNREELLDWLDELESAADPEHPALVEEVYGSGWQEPYTTMLVAKEGERE